MLLGEYMKALGLTHGQFADAISKATGERVSTHLIDEVRKGRPIAQKKAHAICDYLGDEFERLILIADVDDLKVC